MNVYSQSDTALVTGTLQQEFCNETSGITASAKNKEVFYIHNDSGDSSRFFAINSKGDVLATCYFRGEPSIKLGVRDCEDIASGPGPKKGESYLYLGDIGDNFAQRKYITVYRVREPEQLKTVMNLQRQTLFLKYPDGPRDAETLMVDPMHKAMYIISKRNDTAAIYSASLNFKSGDTVVLSKKGTFYLRGTMPGKWIVSGEISRDGKHVLIKTALQVLYWTRERGQAIEKTLRGTPIQLPYIHERQGEAICFSPDGKGYYTVGEGMHAEIYRYHHHTVGKSQ